MKKLLSTAFVGRDKLEWPSQEKTQQQNRIWNLELFDIYIRNSFKKIWKYKYIWFYKFDYLILINFDKFNFNFN